jgi:hypothetical protein
MLSLWSSAYLGCGLYLLVGLRPSADISATLLAELSWLALLGSIPTTLVLAAASRVANSTKAVLAASALAIAVLTAAVGWEHIDFLLSGPRWFEHPRRPLARLGAILALAALSAGGWLWLVRGARLRGRLKKAAYAALTLLGVGLLMAALMHYRAYDYAIAQLVFPSGLLSGAFVWLLVRSTSVRWIPIVLALCGAVFALGSRFTPARVATGQREVIGQSRAGALASLYVLPHLQTETKLGESAACPDPRAAIEDAPLWVRTDQRRNVIVVSVDALRKDVVGSTVHGRQVTPELSRWSKKGISFENATTTYPATLFAVGSAFTGLSPAELYLSPSLPETIFTRSRAHLDQQFAVLPDVSWFRLPIVEQFLAPGVDTGYARNDADATDALLARLRTARQDNASVMAWVHYYGPHDPYEAHPSFPFGSGRKNAYLSEVAAFDAELGRLMRYLEEDGWLEDTLVVFFSDHGEALGERSYFGHHVYLDAWMVDVPLLLSHAAFEAAEPPVGVSLADVAPSILHFLGLPIPRDIAAQSLFTLDPNQPDRPSVSEAFPVRGRQLFDSFRLPALDEASIRRRLRSIRISSKGYEPKHAISFDRYRLIHHRGADASFVYDRERGEESKDAATLARLQAELERWEQAQLQRIQCRLKLKGAPAERPRPE